MSAAGCCFVASSGACTVLHSFVEDRLQADDVVTAEGLEKWLKTAADHTAQGFTIDFDLADPRRPRDLLGRGHAHETHLHSLHWKLACHASQAKEPPERRHPWNYRSGAEPSCAVLCCKSGP